MLLKDDKQPATITSTDGVYEKLSEDDKLGVQLLVSLILENMNGGDWKRAAEIWDSAELTTDQRVAAWSFLDSRQRAFLKGDSRKYLEDES